MYCLPQDLAISVLRSSTNSTLHKIAFTPQFTELQSKYPVNMLNNIFREYL